MASSTGCLTKLADLMMQPRRQRLDARESAIMMIMRLRD